MKTKHFTALLLWVTSSVFFWSCGTHNIDQKRLSLVDSTGTILVDQLGYPVKAQKIALLRKSSSGFYVVDATTGKIIFEGRPGPMEYWKYSGDSAAVADFSSLTVPGRYKICIEGYEPCSWEFEISDTVYRDVAKAAIKAYYYNRCSYEIDREFGGAWARPAGHPDTAVLVHASAATKLRPAGFKISSPGGWYDAGDYNKYVVNSGITTYTLLLFYQMYPQYSKDLKLDIPENSNDIPDVVDELLYNLRWMLTMQDPNDGGVYHKLTNKNFDAFIMPDKAVEPRYVVQKTTAATLDFIAVTSVASRLFSGNTNPALKEISKACAKAAGKAREWVKNNPKVYYVQPSDISTGMYPDSSLSDEYFWANTEYALLTNDTALISPETVESQKLVTPSWGETGMLGLMSLSVSDNPAFNHFKAFAVKRLEEFDNQLEQKRNQSPYRISLDFFKWGSNSDLLNQAMVQIVLERASGDTIQNASVQSDIDYILGRNATDYCFITGFGKRSPMHIHHRPSEADGIQEPVPGFVVGGPNRVTFADCNDEATRSPYPAKAYVDRLCSYSTNEIAINWNAPLFFVLAAKDATVNTTLE